MNPEPNQRQLDALEKYLRGELDASHPDLPVGEAALARQIQKMAARMQPDPQFVAALNKQLAQPRRMPAGRRPNLKVVLSSLAGMAALVLLAFILRWLILSVAPQPPVPALSFTQTPAPAATVTPPAPVSTDTAQQYYAPLFSEPYSLAAGFPAGPAQANLYEQVIPETTTLEAAHALAAQFGLGGDLFLAPETGPHGEPVFLATDGKQRLYIYNTKRYNYFSDWVRLQETKDKSENAQFSISQAEAYLQAHDLLDFPYHAETSPENSGLVSFALTLDGVPVRYSSMHVSPKLEVQISSEGQVVYIYTDLPSYKLVGSYPLRTAENAWEKVVGISTDLGLVGDFSTSSYSEIGRTWLRRYPVGQPLRLGGMLEKIPSAEGGKPFLSINNYALDGNLSGLEQLAESTIIVAQGQFVQVGEVLRFQVETWQKIASDEFLTGSLDLSGEQVFLLSEDGRRLELPDLPPEVFPAAQGKEFHTRGISNGESLDWSSVSVGPLGYGGGCEGQCGGITSLAKLNLSGTPAPTATPQVIATSVPAESIIGQRLVGTTGSLNITIFESKDGQKRTQVSLGVDTSDGGRRDYRLNDGPALVGIEKYNLQPVRVWGTVSSVDSYNSPVVTVERYEPLYPDLKMQSWVGKEDIFIIQGKSVIRFTSEDGHVYVTKDSLRPDFDPANQPPVDGRIFVQGFVLPGEDWGGHQVIDLNFPRSVLPVSDTTESLEEIQKEFPPAEQPDVLPEGIIPIPPTGAKIEKIELVYLARDVRGLPESDLPNQLYIQPAWSFSGHYADGTPFEIYVQALTDAYLLPEPEQ